MRHVTILLWSLESVPLHSECGLPLAGLHVLAVTAVRASELRGSHSVHNLNSNYIVHKITGHKDKVLYNSRIVYLHFGFRLLLIADLLEKFLWNKKFANLLHWSSPPNVTVHNSLDLSLKWALVTEGEHVCHPNLERMRTEVCPLSSCSP